MLLVVDGSSVVTTNYYATLPKELMYMKTEEERETKYDELLPKNDFGEFINAVRISINQIVGLTNLPDVDHVAVCFDRSRNTFRRKQYPEYKGNRGVTPRPLKTQLYMVSQILSQQLGIRCLWESEYEADDIAGTLARKYAEEYGVILYTKDHDWLQLVSEDVLCLMRQKDQEEADRINSTYGHSWMKLPGRTALFDKKTVIGEMGIVPSQIPDLKGLAGDQADNIPGVKGVSEATAKKLLSRYTNIEEVYYSFMKEGVDETETAKIWKSELGITRPPIAALTDQIDNCFLSRELAKIVTDVPLDFDYDHLKICIEPEMITSINKYC